MEIESITEVNNGYPFSVIMPVRITDINYGKHLGHKETIGIFHNARVLFLNENGFDEMNVDGSGVILLSANYTYENETSFNTKLLVSVGIGEYTKLKFNFIYKATNYDTDEKIAGGQEGIVFFNYEKRRVSRIPNSFYEFCKTAQVKES